MSGLTEEDIKSIVEHYDKGLAKHGTDVKSLYWGSTESQRIRFEVLTQIGNLHGRSILDIGCGFGDLCGFLREQGIRANYLGVDVNPNMIEIARRRYPERRYPEHVPRRLFSVADVLSDTYMKHADYVFESGIFTMGVACWLPFVKRMLVKMFELANIGIGFNIQSSWRPEGFAPVPDGMNFDPLYWIAFCREQLSPSLVFKHDYLPHDSTIFVYKELLGARTA